jgi:hypothetical protein
LSKLLIENLFSIFLALLVAPIKMKLSQSLVLALPTLICLIIKGALGQGFLSSCSGIELATPELKFTCLNGKGGSHSGEENLDLCVDNQNGQLVAGNESVSTSVLCKEESLTD